MTNFTGGTTITVNVTVFSFVEVENEDAIIGFPYPRADNAKFSFNPVQTAPVLIDA
jgi:hypothetical protein